MHVNPQAITAMQAITVSREYGSGGGEIAARLARRLGWQLVDHAVIEQAARELEVNESEVEKHDEDYVEESDRPGILSRILEKLAPSTPMTGGGGVFMRPSLPRETETLPYQETMRNIITAAAATGHVVIVGRGGQVLLADRRDVLHVRIVAPLEQRVAYVVRREGLDTEEARKRVQAKDQARARFMQAQYRSQHEDPHLYDLVINTAVLSLDNAVDQICLALEGKASRLSVPEEQLGPAADVAPYAARPADFRVRERPSS